MTTPTAQSGPSAALDQARELMDTIAMGIAGARARNTTDLCVGLIHAGNAVSELRGVVAALTGKADGGDADSYVIHTEVGDLKCSLAVCREWGKLVVAHAALEASIGKADNRDISSANYEAGFKAGMKFQAEHFDTQPAATGMEDASIPDGYTLFPTSNLTRMAETLEHAGDEHGVARDIRAMVAASPALAAQPAPYKLTADDLEIV